MSETEELKESFDGKLQKGTGVVYSRLFLLLIFLVAVIYLVVSKIDVFGNILLALIGLGAMVLVHEFGHFIFAKLTGIKVEAFSIGFPPILAGIRRTEKGYRMRILPGFFPSEDKEGRENSADGHLSFTIGNKTKSGETEYQIGLVPFGGFVKMLGQEDIGQVKTSDDPRSYSNKPVGARAAVISAGVVFNVISAMLVFMLVFMIGIKLPAPVVGGVRPDSPAEKAGLTGGDEIIEIAGKSDNLDFSDIGMAAALSGEGQAVPLKVKHADGLVEDFSIVAEETEGTMGSLRLFGIERPQSLEIAKVSDPDSLFEKTGLLPGDKIKSVDGKEVNSYWEMEEIIRNTFARTVTIIAEKRRDSEQSTLVETQIPLVCMPSVKEVKNESDLSHIYSMVPRVRIFSVRQRENQDSNEPFLQAGDVILSAGEVENPTYMQLREVTREHEGKELSVKVLRKDSSGFEEALIVTVKPTLSRGRVVIGFTPSVDLENAVVAGTVNVEGGPAEINIPAGARITAVDGAEVSSFYDVIEQIRRHRNERITLAYRLNDQVAGSAFLDVDDGGELYLESNFAEIVPFKTIRRVYKATGPVDAIVMGIKKTARNVMLAYLTLRRFVEGSVDPENFMGPIGIIAFSYHIVKESALIDYVYFLGIISAFIAVVNFLPMLPFDGGHIVFMLIEKIKGTPVNEKIQTSFATVGWVLVGALALYVTFNDVARIVKGVF